MRTRSINILFALSGNANKASSRVRGFWVAEELERLGHRCTLRYGDSKLALSSFVLQIPRHDVVIFQKTFGRYHAWLLRLAKFLGKQTYVDIDDNPSPTQAPKTLRRVEGMFANATGVFAGSRNLVEYAMRHNPNTHLIPSCIKLDKYPNKPRETKGPSAPVCLGWIGNGGYYGEDLVRILAEPLRQLAKKYPLQLKIVGACANPLLGETFDRIKGITYDGIDQIDWSNPNEVIQHIHSFDIGLYPLLENEINRYKCGFKALEYMACGIPAVSSRVAINAEIIEHDTSGYLADSAEDWTMCLEKLITSAEKRITYGSRGRELVERRYAIQQAAYQILEIINRT